MTLTLAQAVTVAILTLSSFFCGWFLYRLRAKGREADLQRIVLETKGMIPQLEATVRNREQRVGALAAEIEDGKSRIAALEASMRDREKEVYARDRALRSLNSELTLLKETAAQAAAAVPTAADADAITALREEIERAQRRNAELEARLAATTLPAVQTGEDPAAPVPAAAAPEHLARLDALGSDLAERDRTIADLQDRLRAESAHCGSLGATIETQEAQLAELREEIAKWRARVPKLVESLKEREERIAEVGGRLSALEESRLSAARRSEALEAALAATKTALANAEAGQQAAIRAQHVAEERARSLELEGRDLAARTHAVEAALAERAQRLTELESERTATAAAAEEARNEFAKKLATSIRLGREEIDRLGRELGAEIDRLTRDLGDAITRRNEAVEQVAELRAELEAGRHVVEAAEAREARFDSEQRELLERVESLERARDEAVGERQALELRLASLGAELSVREARVADLESAATAASEARSAAAAAEARLLDRQRGLEAEVAALSERVGVLTAELDSSLARLAAVDAERAELAARAKSTEEAAIAARAAHADEAVTLREELRQAQVRVAPLEALVEQKESALAERASRIESLQDQLERVQRTLAERDAAPQEAKPVHEKIDYLEQRVAAQFDRNRELSATVDALERTIAELTRDQALKDKSLAVLQQQLEHLNAANERMATELRELRTFDAPPLPVDSGPPPRRPDGLFSTAPDRADDLQQIRGIGAAFEHRLNELGIYQLGQIATLDDAEIAWLENELRMFRGRIRRDGWISQALALMGSSPWLANGGRADAPPTFASP